MKNETTFCVVDVEGVGRHVAVLDTNFRRPSTYFAAIRTLDAALHSPSKYKIVSHS